jgi:hypothetical protein
VEVLAFGLDTEPTFCHHGSSQRQRERIEPFGYHALCRALSACIFCTDSNGNSGPVLMATSGAAVNYQRQHRVGIEWYRTTVGAVSERWARKDR